MVAMWVETMAALKVEKKVKGLVADWVDLLARLSVVMLVVQKA